MLKKLALLGVGILGGVLLTCTSIVVKTDKGEIMYETDDEYVRVGNKQEGNGLRLAVVYDKNIYPKR